MEIKNHAQSVSRHLAARRGEGTYKSCTWIEDSIFIDATKVKMCCIRNMGNDVVPTFFEVGDHKDAARQILESKRGLRLANQTSKSPCDGCFLLREQEWKAKDHVEGVAISGFLHCNLACTYCSTYQYDPSDRGSPTLEMLKTWFDIGFIRPGGRFEMGGGESTLHREFDAIAAFAFERGMHMHVYTNGVGVSKSLLVGLEKKLAAVMISVDAGTNETYRRIKKKDVLHRVWETIKTYAAIDPQRTQVKYIMMASNNSKSELDAYVEKLKISGAKAFFIAANVLQNLENEGKLSGIMKRSMAYLYRISSPFGSVNFSETISAAEIAEIIELSSREDDDLFPEATGANWRGQLELAFTDTKVFLDRANSITAEEDSFVIQFSSPVEGREGFAFLGQAVEAAQARGATVADVRNSAGQLIGVDVVF